MKPISLQGRYTNERDSLLRALETLAELYDAMGAPRGPTRIIAEAAITQAKLTILPPDSPLLAAAKAVCTANSLALSWLSSAIQCGDFKWDADQKSAAQESLSAAQNATKQLEGAVNGQ